MHKHRRLNFAEIVNRIDTLLSSAAVYCSSKRIGVLTTSFTLPTVNASTWLSRPLRVSDSLVTETWRFINVLID